MPFIWVKDKESGHEFDVPAEDWRVAEGILTPVKSDRYPEVDRPRPPKHNIQPIRASKKEES
jgi:hypothetical protein